MALLMEYAETNCKNDEKLEVNENCSQSFTASSSVARSESDSDEGVLFFLEMGDIDSQTGTSKLSGCEIKVYDETKGVRNRQFDQFFSRFKKIFCIL